MVGERAIRSACLIGGERSKVHGAELKCPIVIASNWWPSERLSPSPGLLFGTGFVWTIYRQFESTA